ncbi:MAG: hypothetical protein ACREC5_03610, partial [Thermoplasmata archaeon]
MPGVRFLPADAGFAERFGMAFAAGEGRERARGLAHHPPTEHVGPEEECLCDSLRTDGTPGRKLRPTALLAVAEGLRLLETGWGVLRRAQRGDLAMLWGPRTISDRDPGDRPPADHDGPV